MTYPVLRPRERELYDLLAALFVPDELRRFVFFAFGEDVARALAGGAASHAELTFSALQLLLSRGLVGEQLAKELVSQRPACAAEIAAVFAHFTDYDAASPTAAPRQARSRAASQVFLASGAASEMHGRVVSCLAELDVDVVDRHSVHRIAPGGAVHAGEALLAGMRGASAVIVLVGEEDDDGPRVFRDTRWAEAHANLLIMAGMAFALKPKHTVFVKVGRPGLFDLADPMRGILTVALDETQESVDYLVFALRQAGCSVKGTPRPVTGLPGSGAIELVQEGPRGASVALFRRIRALLPFPSMGASMEIVDRVVEGQQGVISVNGEVSPDDLLLHWPPGAAAPIRITIPPSVAGPRTIPFEVSGPPGAHILDLMRPLDAEPVPRRIARTVFTVAGAA